MRTDAAINPGNLGGPLILIDDGTVVRVSAWGVEATKSINFAIPADTAATFMERRAPESVADVERDRAPIRSASNPITPFDPL